MARTKIAIRRATCHSLRDVFRIKLLLPLLTNCTGNRYAQLSDVFYHGVLASDG